MEILIVAVILIAVVGGFAALAGRPRPSDERTTIGGAGGAGGEEPDEILF